MALASDLGFFPRESCLEETPGNPLQQRASARPRR